MTELAVVLNGVPDLPRGSPLGPACEEYGKNDHGDEDDDADVHDWVVAGDFSDCWDSHPS